MKGRYYVCLSRRQIAVRAGRHWFGLRSSAFREYYAERNRQGWRVMYLPFGWRAFHHAESS